MSGLGDLLAPMLADARRLADFQQALNGMYTPADQKRAVMEAFCNGLISHEDTRLLIDVYDLAGA